jgi:hypothetical protein
MAKPSVDYIPGGDFVLNEAPAMTAVRQTAQSIPTKDCRTSMWAGAWHLWTVFVPRRTITGRLAYGKVWRRHNGRRWTYKQFVEFDYPEQPR